MPQPNSRNQLRASDADREQVAQVLGDAHADGRLTAEEYNERLDRLYQGKTHGDLERVRADLDQDSIARTRQHSYELVPLERVRPQVALLSETKARPTGRVAGRMVAVSFLGNVQIDLSYATIDPAGVLIIARAVLGAVNITVPANARVSMTGVPVVGALSPTRDPGPSDGPPIIVKAFAGMGSVTIHRADRDMSGT